MAERIAVYMAGFPSFLLYFLVAVALLAAFSFIYAKITPDHEWTLVKQKNSAAAIAFGGAIIGFVLPLHSAITQSISLLDCVLWGIVALIIQIAAYYGLRLAIRDLPTRVANGEMATGILAAAFFVGVGLLNAASMTYY
ncbi:hypothetical protein CAI21_20495 [Alkalilimnicola ehrlichii]|uniref:DUF350 domain-containing protein n=1 Tax=Alkalilimnicola ehrlichii TaxID=351052 RepID=A0A3E0WTY5_9GAMM|nr:DUF350 domain-containing protein [Alkalilimnicola ehrlichii]RFA24732.1 hypothetical protein CAI21_20495 [Alkalilimnicola ehrlichii]RFA35436.1 hypothetical protein CAL65_13245 [Alkalilimnicola ehrlichii]